MPAIGKCAPVLSFRAGSGRPHLDGIDVLLGKPLALLNLLTVTLNLFQQGLREEGVSTEQAIGCALSHAKPI